MPLTPEQIAAVQAWNEAKNELDRFKQQESMLRDELVKLLFSSKDEGTESIEVSNGWKLKAVKKLDYKLDNKDNQIVAICAMLDPDTAKRLFNWKPDLSVSTYKQLDATTQSLLNGCLTIKPAKASLELVPPKEAN